MDDVDLHGLLRELDERARHGFDRAVHVALDDDVELLERSDGDTAADFVERHVLLGHDALHALQLLAFVGDFACRAVVLHHVERIAGLRCAVQSQHLYRRRGAGGIDLLAVLVEHGLHAARVGARQDHVAHVERTALHEDRRDVPAALVERRFDDRALRLLVGVGLQVEHLGFEQHLFEQFVEVKALLGRNLLILVFTAPRLHQIVHLRELLLDVVGVGVGLVDLVDGEDHRHACGLRMVDGLDRLRHDAVVGRHDDDRDVRYGGTAGTHGREGFVARRIEERDLLAVELDTVRTDVLRDTPGLAFDDVGFADVVQQRGLTVVDVSHDRDDRRTGHEVFLLVFALVVDGLLDLDRDEFDLVAELLGDHDERFGVEALVDGDHQSQVHAGRDDLRGRHVHHRRQLAHGHELRDFEGRAFLFLAFELFVHTLGNGVAFILAVFGTLAFGTLGRQACQGVLYLLRNLLVAHFGAYDRLGCGLAFVFVAAAFARFGLVLGAGTVLPALSGTVLAALAPLSTLLVAAALRIAPRGLADVDFLLLQALALVLAAGHESRHVHRTEYLRPGEGHGLRTEDVVFGSGRFRRGCRGFCGLGVRLPGSLCCGCRRGRCCGFCRFSGSSLCCGRRRGRCGVACLCSRGWLCRTGFRYCGCGGRCGLCGSFGRLGRCRCSGCRRMLCGGFFSFCLRGGGSLGFGRQVDLAEELRLLDFVLDADYVAFDDHLFFLLALLLLSFFEGDGRLLQGDTLADRLACIACGAVRPELLLQDGISLRVDQRIGRPVALDALLLQEVRDGIQSHLELLCNLNEP